MNKHTIRILFLLAMCLFLLSAAAFAENSPEAAAVYDLWVGGEQVTSRNAADVFGDGTVSYNAETKTLTLSDYHYEGDGYLYLEDTEDPEHPTLSTAVVYSGESLGIVVNGSSKLTNTFSNPDAGKRGDCIFAGADLTISGSGALELTGCCGIRNAGDLTMTGSSVRVTGAAAEDGIRAEGKLTMSDCAVTVEGSVDNGVYVKGSLNATRCELTVNGANGDAVYTRGNLTIDSSTVTLTGSGEDGLDSRGNMSLNNCDVAIMADGRFGVYCVHRSDDGVLDIRDSVLTISAGEYGIYGEHIKIADCTMDVTTPTGGVYGKHGLVIDGSALTVKTGPVGIYSLSCGIKIDCSETVRTPSSIFVTTEGEEALAVGSMDGPLTLGGRLAIFTPESGRIVAGEDKYDSDYDGVNDTSYTYEVIADAEGNDAACVSIAAPPS